MSQQLQQFSITNPGFFGLNIQDSPVDMPTGYAIRANNCVIDSSGRIAARKGWAKVNATNTDLGTNNITCIGELIDNAGTITTLAAGGGFLFKLSGSTLTTLTYGGGGSAPTISANNWTFCQLNGIAMFWQRGYDPLIYDPAVSTTTFRRLNEKSGSAGTIPQCNAAISALGRVWYADTATDKNTVGWSDILTPHIVTGGTSGTLNLLGVWPQGMDEIVTLAVHNNQLIIFGKRQILIYSGADNPAGMQLADTVSTIGCIARDSVQNIGTDLIFLSSSGLRSLGRTIQEKSLPIGDLSRNVHDEVIGHIDAETPANIKSVYSEKDAFYLLTFPSVSEVYCFDVRTKLENGALRVTTWDSNVPKAFYSSVANKKLYFGKAGYIGHYGTYLDDTATYRLAYNSTHIDFGEPVVTSILKKILVTTVGLEQTIIVKWAFDFLQRFHSQSVVVNSGTANIALYNISEYNTTAEYSTPVAAAITGVHGSGYGKTIQLVIECQINGYALSIQKLDIFTKRGKLQ